MGFFFSKGYGKAELP